MSKPDLKSKRTCIRFLNPSIKLSRTLSQSTKDLNSRASLEKTPGKAFQSFAKSPEKSIAMDKHLCIRAEDLALNEPVSYKKLQIFQDAFEKIVQSDNPAHQLLCLIKAVYDKFISTQIAEIQEMNKTINNLKENLQKKREVYRNKTFYWKEIQLKNIEITHQNAQLLEHNRKLETKISKITKELHKTKTRENPVWFFNEFESLCDSLNDNSISDVTESILPQRICTSSNYPLNTVPKK